MAQKYTNPEEYQLYVEMKCDCVRPVFQKRFEFLLLFTAEEIWCVHTKEGYNKIFGLDFVVV